MSLEDNKAITLDWLQKVVNQGDLTAVDEFFTSDLVNHAILPGMALGSEGLKQLIAFYRSGFPDFHVTTEYQVAEMDKVVTAFTAAATHREEFLGIPATGRQVSFPGICTCRFAPDNKIVELWVLSDTQGLLQQLTSPSS